MVWLLLARVSIIAYSSGLVAEERLLRVSFHRAPVQVPESGVQGIAEAPGPGRLVSVPRERLASPNRLSVRV